MSYLRYVYVCLRIVTFDWDKMSAFVKDKVSDDVFFSLYSVTFSDVLKELRKP